MAVNGINNASSKLRLSGLSSGLDTDSIISSLMKVEKVPIDKIQQKKQLAEWKRDSYRDITNLLRGIKDEFFNSTKPESNITFQSSFKKFKATSSDSGVITATAGADASGGTFEVKVQNMAKAATSKSSDVISKAVESTTTVTSDDIVAASGRKLKMTLDGVTKEVTLGTYTAGTSLSDFASDIQSKIGIEFGAGKISVNVTGTSNDKLTFSTTGGASKLTMQSASGNDALDIINISSGAANRISTSDTIGALASKLGKTFTTNSQGNISFSINSKEFSFSTTTTVSSMLSTINNDATAKVKMTYDETSDKFSIVSKQMGSGNNIQLSEGTGSTFLQAINLTTPTYTPGEDAQIILDGQTITRSSNTINANGISFNILSEGADTETVALENDSEVVFNNIKSFITKYNDAIKTINDKITEKYDRDYQPLTDDQKEGMETEDIEKWDKKAKTGILRNDRTLESILTNLRSALNQSVDGMKLSDIGITTGTYSEKGKLSIDEDKLRKAIENDPDKVMNLFSKQSESYPASSRTLNSSQRSIRFSEEGLAQKFSDIIEDNISTIRDSGGKKGLLLQIAGMSGDISEYSNSLYKEISGYDSKMTELYDKLGDKETQLYKKYSSLETYMQKMNSQSSWLSSQLGSS